MTSVATGEGSRLTSSAAIPQISVVTPAFNAEATLPRVFASLRAQRMVEWEHIVVIDGATDVTAAIAHAAAARDDRVTVLEQANAGASSARNAGLAVARGEWVLFLDADDTIARDHLRRMVARAAATPGTDAVCCGYQRCDAAGRVTERYPAPIFRGQAPFRSIVGTPPTVIHGVLARRSLILDVGGFDTGLATNEDWDLWIRLARASMGFVREPRRLAMYWNAEQSLTRDPVAMVRDVMTVLARAGRADPRVPHPLPDFADGIRIGSHDENILSCALWSAGSDIGRGGDGMAAMSALPDRMGQPWNRLGLAVTLLDGMMVGSGGRAVDIARSWATYAARVDALFADIERRCDGDGLDYALRREVEWEVGRLSRLPGQVMIGRTWSVRLTPLTLFRPLTPPDDAEVVQLHPMGLPSSPKLMFHAVATRPSTAREVRRQVVRELWRRGLRMLARAVEVKPALAPAIDRGMMGLALVSRLPRRLLGRNPTPAATVDARIDEPASGESSTPGWDAFFRTEDPWGYGSAYEQLKYRRTLDLLPDRPIGRAIELACAEGMFTQRLASRVKHLTATDISAVALERAAARCAGEGGAGVEFKLLDFFREPLGEEWDLIVSSEVLYYMSGTAELEAYAARVEAALAPDGLFLHAHAFEVTDDRSHTGFDWEDPFGADTISRTFRARAGLERVRAVTTDLYLIELYRRVAPAARMAHVAPEVLPLGTELEPGIAGMVVWNGAIRTRPEVHASERTARLPVLMYHHVADTGPAGLAPWRVTRHDFEHQLRFLRRRGYRSVTIDEWEQADRNSASLRGRPVLITFDDAYVNFAENAWPILERNGFSAHMFVVTGKVGKTADWDAGLGEPARLMDWDGLIDLHRRGLSIGSHLDMHLASDRIPVRRLLDEAVRSRSILEERFGVPVTTVAPPFGAMNIRVEQILREAGYTRIFDASGSVAPVWGTRWKVPRVDVMGTYDIATFAAKMGHHGEPPEAGDLP